MKASIVAYLAKLLGVPHWAGTPVLQALQLHQCFPLGISDPHWDW
jgi:hypothetical protein